MRCNSTGKDSSVSLNRICIFLLFLSFFYIFWALLGRVQKVTMHLQNKAGFEITAGQRTMCGLIGELTGHPFVSNAAAFVLLS